MTSGYKGMYAGWALDVDLTAGSLARRSLDEDLVRSYVGGRGFTSRLQYLETGRSTDPLGSENVLIIALGGLTGAPAPASSRFTAGGKSPLTGILGDSNCGGHFGPELRRAGYDLIVFRGRSPRPVYLWIDDGEVALRDAAHLWGKTTLETDCAIKEEVGDPDVQIAAIGPAGENLVRFAAIIANLDHAAGRTGMGALMGSKKLKAIAARGTQGIRLADPACYREVAEELMGVIMNDEVSGQLLPAYGTTALTTLHNTMGIMATRNWQTGVFEGANKVDEKAIEEYLLKARACYNCPCRCDRYTVVENGEFKGTRTGGPEYFTVVSFGSKCGNDNLPSILKANELCNLYGLDTASTGGIIGFAFECFEKGILTSREADGLDLTWGNYHAILALVEKIAYRHGLGDVLAEGIVPAAARIGKGAERYAMHAKGQDLVAPDPRGLKVYNFRYAVASRGGDHLRISAHGAYALEKLPVPEAAQQMRFWQDVVCVPDLMGLCKFPLTFYSESPEATFRKALDLVPRLYTAAAGIELTREELLRVATRVATLERAYNSRLGLTREHDVLPRRFHEEPLPEGPKKGQVMDILEELKTCFYEAYGWDPNTGVPTRATLEELELAEVADELARCGVPVASAATAKENAP